MSLHEPDLPDELPCEVCGEPVQNEPYTPGLVINYYGLVVPWSHSYGFCEEHKPEGERLDEVKRRIKRGLDPLPD